VYAKAKPGFTIAWYVCSDALPGSEDIFETAYVHEYAGEDDEGNAHYESQPRLVVADIKKLPEHVQRAIKEVKITRKPTGDIVEVKMYDKQVALEKLFRHYGLFEQDHKQKAKSMQDSFIDLLFGATANQGLPSPVADDDVTDL